MVAERIPTFSEFLAKQPPGREMFVYELIVPPVERRVPTPGLPDGRKTGHLDVKDIRIECISPECDGERTFEGFGGQEPALFPTNPTLYFLRYTCRDCRKYFKVFAIRATAVAPEDTGGKVLKLGEDPPFGPTTPARVITLIGPDKEVFLKGRRCELQGLGVGAFAYYRRVIENQKNRLLDEVIRVATKVGTSPDVIRILQTAKNETQFSKAIEGVKDGIPREIMINGHNPLTLLHSALSEGLHMQSDEQCLELATSIREVLFAFAERMASVLREQAGLERAVSRLSQKG